MHDNFDKMRIVYLGSGHPSEPSLKEVIKKFKVEAVIHSNVPKNIPSKASTSEGVIRIAKENGIPVYPPTELDVLNQIKPDLVILNNYRDIIPSSYLEKFRFINVHYSLLPRYRGMHSTQWAIINDEKYVGYTIYWMTEEVDAGDIIFQQKIEVKEEDDINSLYSKLNNDLANSICEVLGKIEDGTALRIKQDLRKSIFIQQRKPEDGLIDWSKNSRYVFNLVRALVKPYPGAFTYHKGKKVIIWKASMFGCDDYLEIPGHIVSVLKNKGVLVKTKDNVICIEEIDVEGEIFRADEYFKRPGARLKNE